jgi:hypothetical protein
MMDVTCSNSSEYELEQGPESSAPGVISRYRQPPATSFLES